MGDVPERVLRDCLDWLGFGHLDAPLWFVGLEERFSLARCARVADRRQYFDLRRGLDPTADFVTVWEDVYGRPTAEGEGGRATRWWASAFTLAYQGTDVTDLPTAVRRARIRNYTYDNPRIGRRDGDTLVANVYPLPELGRGDAAPYDHVWDTTEEYRADVHPRRLDQYADAIRNSAGVECIVAHAPAEHFADPVTDRFDATRVDTWPAARDATIDAYRLAGDAAGTILLDTPPLGDGHVTYDTIQFAADRARAAVEDARATV